LFNVWLPFISEGCMSLRVAIVGGGIGGLAAALFLRRAGVDAEVYEQMPVLREVGAGIVVAPNMVRPLARLGLLGQLEAFAPKLDAGWEFRRWQDGRVLSVQTMGPACVDLYGANCHVAHRGDVLNLLRQALPDEAVHLGHELISFKQGDGGVALQFGAPDGAVVSVQADVMIGADGIHSAVRSAIAPQDWPRFSGLCAFRCLVPAEAAPEMALRPVQTLWLGPGRHFVHYPISSGRLVNIVAIVPAGNWRDESWTAPGEVADMAREFEGWDPRVGQLIASARETKRWALFDREPLAQWTQGRVSLLGDAAHPMLPFFAQGSAQAIEDAEALAHALSGIEPPGAPAALQAYEALRRPRATQIQLLSRGREIRNHLPDGQEQQQRDSELASGDPLRQAAWLYGEPQGA
jgi:salicylate hydroxylase